jgi:hypothetical protein
MAHCGDVGSVESVPNSLRVMRSVKPDFFLEDQGDGWWHCDTPLSCFIIDGPAPVPDAGGDFWLVCTEPLIEWHGSESHAERLGRDHSLVNPQPATNVALVMASSRFGPTDRAGAGSLPVYPVYGEARYVADANWIGGLGMKVRLTPHG